MKNLTNFIQEKYLINNDTIIKNVCEDFDELFSKYKGKLFDMSINSADEAAGFVKAIKCTKSIFEHYKNILKNFVQNIDDTVNQIKNYTEESNYRINIESIEDFDNSKWYDISIISSNHIDLVEVIFSKSQYLIKVYLNCSNDKIARKNIMNTAAKIIDFVIS